MPNLNRDIHSLTDFKRNTSDYVKQIKRTREPVVLTVNGKAELVIQDAESYQALMEIVERIQTIEGVQRGLNQKAQGEGAPASDVFAALRQKFNIPALAE